MREIIKYIIPIICVCIQSCSHIKQKKLKDLYNEWYGKEIEIPFDNLSFNHPLRIALYVGSDACAECQLNLPLWKTFISHLDSLTSDAVDICFFIQPYSTREIEIVLKQECFEYPVIIDTADLFNKTNQLPENPSFHCFLLDYDNRVILIGNPVQNPKIRDLYIRTICERLGIKPKLNTVSKPQNRSKNLGTFNWQSEQHTTFSIHNTGNEPMLIDTIFTSCECTTAEIDKRSIEPADSAIVSIRFKAEKPEQFMREVYVGVQGKETIVFSIEGGAME